MPSTSLLSIRFDAVRLRSQRRHLSCLVRRSIRPNGRPQNHGIDGRLVRDHRRVPLQDYCRPSFWRDGPVGSRTKRMALSLALSSDVTSIASLSSASCNQGFFSREAELVMLYRRPELNLASTKSTRVRGFKALLLLALSV